MNLMKKIASYSLVILLTGLSQLTMGQSRKADIYFRNGEKEFNDQRYMYAIPFYRTALKKPGKNDSLAYLHIAESYWFVRNYDSALSAYQAYENRFGPLFSTRQKIAELLAVKGDYASAAAIYRKLQTEIPVRNANLLQERFKGFSGPAKFYKDSFDYKAKLLNLNTTQQDFSPQYYQNGLVFISNRYTKQTAEKEFGWDALPFASIYRVRDTADLYTTDSITGTANRKRGMIKANDDYTSQTSNDNDIIVVSGARSNYNGSIHRLEQFSDQLNTKYNYGPLCFTKAGDKVYFTRNNLKSNKGRFNLEICVATYEKGQWGNIKVMPFVDPAFDFYHPALSADETKLYFCSNKPGGIGGSDIYYVGLTSDFDMSNPAILSPAVNTAGNELFPTIHGDTLYFSSDGWAGLGGLDVYKTWMVRGAWQAPKNLGAPVNSGFDDFGLIYNNNYSKGFFSSNRLGSDDIYVFEKRIFNVQLLGTVLSKATMRRLDSVTVVIRSADPEDPYTDSLVTDITGNYQFPVRPDRGYTLAFNRSGYYPEALKVPNSGTQTQLQLEPVLMTPIPKPEAAPPAVAEKDRDGDQVPDKTDKCPDIKGLKTNYGCPDIQSRLNELAKMVFFKTASAELSPAALKPLNEAADIIKDFPNVTLYIEGHTDNRASAPYNLDLSRRRAKSVKDFFIKRGFAASRFTSEGFGLTRPIGDNNTEEGRALNRRVSFIATFH
jgi:outer membrane protein OmpA-like peptidoglycan-associated protein